MPRKAEPKKTENQNQTEPEDQITTGQIVPKAETEKAAEQNIQKENILKGFRRVLTKELFEELGALQCPVKEILGYRQADQA